MDNLNIQVQGNNQKATLKEIINILEKKGFKQRKAKLLSEDSSGIKNWSSVKKDGVYNLDDFIVVKGIENIDISEIEVLSKKYGNIIYLNFQYETKQKDLEIRNGISKELKLPDEVFNI